MNKSELIELAKMLSLPSSNKTIPQLKDVIEKELDKMGKSLFKEDVKEVKVSKVYKGMHPITGKMIE